MLYKENIALWTPYLYAKPLRHLYSGDKSLLTAAATGVAKNGTMEIVKALAATGPDDKRYLCVLNRGPAVALGGVWIDEKAIARDASVFVESVSGEERSASGAAVKVFTGTKALGDLIVEPFSVMTVVLP
jgi:hypothetical protein